MSEDKFVASADEIFEIIYAGFKCYKMMNGLTRSEELLIMDFGTDLNCNWEYYYKKIKEECRQND